MQRRKCNSETYPVSTTAISGVNLSYNWGYRPNELPPIMMAVLKGGLNLSSPSMKFRTEAVQTVFRESHTQTDPYEPDIKEPYDKKLEILTLDWLTWNNRLPAGIPEAILIERARQRRAWEKSLPPPINKTTEDIRYMVLEAIEVNEWNHREIDYAALSSLRLELAEKCMKEHLATNRFRYESRVFKYIGRKAEEKEAALKRARLKHNRDIHRLTFQKNIVNRKYKRADVFTELSDKTSEFYAPQGRFGVDPRRGHEVIPPEFRYWNVFSSRDVLTYCPKPYQHERHFDFTKHSRPKTYQKICLRHTKWTDYELYQMQRMLRIMGKQKNQEHCHLKVPINHMEKVFKPPAVQGPSEEFETTCQASLFLQKLVKGRAIHNVMIEGRVRCQDLIDELRTTQALQGHVDDARQATGAIAYSEKRRLEIQELEEKRKEQILLSLEGKTVSETLDFLAKELKRLENERLTHAMALMANRARHKLEAEEAGRRQAEEQRRRECDEMYRQVMKIYQNSVDILMDDWSNAVIQKCAERFARMMTEEYAKKIDMAAQESQFQNMDLEEDEIIADLVHNFALPEVEKRIVRKRLQDRQKMTLSACHDEVYSHIEKIAEGPRSPSGTLLPIPKPRTHKMPKVLHMKLLKLKRMSASLSHSGDSVESVPNLFLTDNEF